MSLSIFQRRSENQNPPRKNAEGKTPISKDDQKTPQVNSFSSSLFVLMALQPPRLPFLQTTPPPPAPLHQLHHIIPPFETLETLENLQKLQRDTVARVRRKRACLEQTLRDDDNTRFFVPSDAIFFVAGGAAGFVDRWFLLPCKFPRVGRFPEIVRSRFLPRETKFNLSRGSFIVVSSVCDGQGKRLVGFSMMRGPTSSNRGGSFARAARKLLRHPWCRVR